MQAWSKSVPGGWVFRANCRIRFSFLVPIKEHIEEWNKLNADPGTRNAEHKIDFLIAWTIDERKDGVAAFGPYVSQCQKEEMCIGSKAYHRKAHEGLAQAKI